METRRSVMARPYLSRSGARTSGATGEPTGSASVATDAPYSAISPYIHYLYNGDGRRKRNAARGGGRKATARAEIFNLAAGRTNDRVSVCPQSSFAEPRNPADAFPVPHRDRIAPCAYCLLWRCPAVGQSAQAQRTQPRADSYAVLYGFSASPESFWVLWIVDPSKGNYIADAPTS